MFSVIIDKIIQLAQLSKKQLHDMVVNDNVENDLFYKIFNDWFGKLFKNKEQIYQQLKGIKATKEHASALMNYGQLLNVIFQNNEDVNDIIDLWNNPNDIIILELLCKIDPSQQFNVEQCKKLIKRIYSNQLGDNIPRGPYNSDYLKLIKENIDKLEKIVNNNDNTTIVNLLNNLSKDAIDGLFSSSNDKDIFGNVIIPEHITNALNDISNEKLEQIKDKRDSYSVNFINWIKLLKNNIFDTKVSLYDIYLWGYYNPDYFWNLVKANNINKLREEAFNWCFKTLAQDSEKIKIYQHGPIEEWTNGKNINDPEYIRCVNLNTSLDLVIESQKMNHCAGAMHQIQTEQGKEFFYSFRDKNNNVLATLDIEPTDRSYDKFQISEIRGFNNAVPRTFPTFVQNAIREWIKEHGIIESSNLDFKMERMSEEEIQSEIANAKEEAITNNNPQLLSELIANKYITKETDKVSFYAVVLSAIANGKGHDLIFNHIVNEEDGDLYEIIVYGLNNVGFIKRKVIQGLVYVVNKTYPDILSDFNINDLNSGMIGNNDPLEINGMEIFQINHGLILFGIIKPGNKYFDVIYKDMLKSNIEPKEQVMILSNSAINKEKPYTEYYYKLMDQWIKDDDDLVNDLILNGAITRLDGKERYEKYLGMMTNHTPRVKSYVTKSSLEDVIDSKYLSRYDDVINIPDNILKKNERTWGKYVQYRKSLSDDAYVNDFIKKNINNATMMANLIYNHIIDINHESYSDIINSISKSAEESYYLINKDFFRIEDEESYKKLLYSAIDIPAHACRLLSIIKPGNIYYDDVFKSAIIDIKNIYTIIFNYNLVEPYMKIAIDKAQTNTEVSYRLIANLIIDIKNPYFNLLFNSAIQNEYYAHHIFERLQKELNKNQIRQIIIATKNNYIYADYFIRKEIIDKDKDRQLYNELIESAIKDEYNAYDLLKYKFITREDGQLFLDAIKNVEHKNDFCFGLLDEKVIDENNQYYFSIIARLVSGSVSSAYQLISGNILTYNNINNNDDLISEKDKKIITVKNRFYNIAMEKVIKSAPYAYELLSNNLINKNSPYFNEAIETILKDNNFAKLLMLNKIIDKNNQNFRKIIETNLHDIRFIYNLLFKNILEPNDGYYEKMIELLLKSPNFCYSAIITDHFIDQNNPYYIDILKQAVYNFPGILINSKIDKNLSYQVLMEKDYSILDLRNVLMSLFNSDLSEQQKKNLANKYPEYKYLLKPPYNSKIINKIVKLSLSKK